MVYPTQIAGVPNGIIVPHAGLLSAEHYMEDRDAFLGILATVGQQLSYLNQQARLQEERTEEQYIQINALRREGEFLRERVASLTDGLREEKRQRLNALIQRKNQIARQLRSEEEAARSTQRTIAAVATTAVCAAGGLAFAPIYPAVLMGASIPDLFNEKARRELQMEDRQVEAEIHRLTAELEI